MARSDPMADASLPDMRARSRPGTAIAAMMPMIATTINSSIRVKPLELRIFISLSSRKKLGQTQSAPEGFRYSGRDWTDHEQPECQGSSVRELIYKCFIFY